LCSCEAMRTADKSNQIPCNIRDGTRIEGARPRCGSCEASSNATRGCRWVTVLLPKPLTHAQTLRAQHRPYQMV
jgi:hypothetical protein